MPRNSTSSDSISLFSLTYLKCTNLFGWCTNLCTNLKSLKNMNITDVHRVLPTKHLSLYIYLLGLSFISKEKVGEVSENKYLGWCKGLVQ